MLLPTCSTALWTNTQSWVDNNSGANDWHSDFNPSWGRPSRALDASLATHAGFYNDHGFFVMDVNQPVSGMRYRNDGDQADVKDIVLSASNSLASSYTTVCTMSATTSTAWQECLPFTATSERYYKFTWTTNHGMSAATRIVDLQLDLAGERCSRVILGER